MKTNEDRRIRKTKMVLEKSLLELIKQKPMNEITVKELVELADLNRSTFYHYYSDVPSMVEHLEQRLYDELKEMIGIHIEKTRETPHTPEHSLEYIVVLCTTIKNNSELCKGIFSKNGDMNFLTKIEDLIEWNTRSYLKEPFINLNYIPLLHSFFRSGCIGLMKRWIGEDFQETPEEIAKLIYEVAKGLIHNFESYYVEKASDDIKFVSY